MPVPALLEVYDIVGRRVATLVEGELRAGRHEATFKADNLPSGVYVYRLRVGGQTLERQMFLLK